MWKRFEESGWFAFVFGLALGISSTYLLVGTDVGSAIRRGLAEIRWEVWASMIPIWLAGGFLGLRLARRRGAAAAEPGTAADGGGM